MSDNISTPQKPHESKKGIFEYLISATSKLKTIQGFLAAVGGLALILGGLFVFVMGPKEGALYHIDNRNGWMYAGSSYYTSVINNLSSVLLTANELKTGAKFDPGKNVIAAQCINLRERPAGAINLNWLPSFIKPERVRTIRPGNCLRINNIADSGIQSIWFHVTLIDKEICGTSTEALVSKLKIALENCPY
jgi:hypothetical protein